jgi:hypothetical protein
MTGHFDVIPRESKVFLFSLLHIVLNNLNDFLFKKHYSINIRINSKSIMFEQYVKSLNLIL